MNADRPTPEEFDELVLATRETGATLEKYDRLVALVASDPQLAERYVELTHLFTQLNWSVGDEPPTVRGPAPASVAAQGLEIDPLPSPARRISMATRHMAVGITIAVAFVATSLSVMHQILLPVRVATEEKGSDKKTAKETGPVESIARLVNDANARWEGHVENPVFGRKQRVKTGMKLYPGQKLKLVSGLAEFKFYNGAEVVLEGPAEFEVRGKKQCGLTIGKLVAKAHEERSKGFIVDTPTGLVEDLGTEFGVEIGRGGDLNVHVFEGEVTLEERMADGSLGAPLTITGGHFGSVARADGVPNWKNRGQTQVRKNDALAGILGSRRHRRIRRGRWPARSPFCQSSWHVSRDYGGQQ